MTALMSLDAIIFQWSEEAKSSETVDDVPDIRKDSFWLVVVESQRGTTSMGTGEHWHMYFSTKKIKALFI